MVRSCSTCRHISKPILDEPCLSCFASDAAYLKWQPGHSCSNCKHRDKKITEEPCLDCDIRARNDKWEGKDD